MNAKMKRIVCAGSVITGVAIGILANYVKKKKVLGKYGNVKTTKKWNRKRGYSGLC